MALSGKQITQSFLAGAAISQYNVVKWASTAGEVIPIAATSDRGIGVCVNDPADGEVANVVLQGVAIAVCGTSNLAVGENLGFAYTSTTGAYVVDHTTDNRPSIGFALEASTALGDQVQIMVTGLSRY